MAAHYRYVKPKERPARRHRRQTTWSERDLWMGGSKTQQESGDGGAEFFQDDN